LDYTREHRTKEGENPAGRLLLFTEKDIAKAHYALGNLTNKAIALEYEVILPEAATHSGRTDSIRRSIGQRSLEKNSTASGPDAPPKRAETTDRNRTTKRMELFKTDVS